MAHWRAPMLARLILGVMAVLATAFVPTPARADTVPYVTLAASSTLVQPGQPVTVTATVTGTGWSQVTLRADGSVTCLTSPCSITVSRNYVGPGYFYAAVNNPQSAVAQIVVTWGQASDRCGTRLFDGYVAGNYALFGVDGLVPGTYTDSAVVCYRVDKGGVELYGGAVTAHGTVGFDSSDSACNAPGNTVPGTHPLVSGTAVGASFSIDLFQDGSGNTWLCIGTLGRFRFTSSGVGAPASVETDSGSTPEPTRTYPPASYPSATCTQSGRVALVDAALLDWYRSIGAYSASLSISTYSPDQTTTNVCVSLNPGYPLGTTHVGGMFTLKGPSVPQLSSDLSPCTFTVFQLVNPSPVLLATSPAGSTPATVCVAAGGAKFAVTVGNGSIPSPLNPIQFTPDPGP
jgi:hypothetical protein